MKSLTLVSYNIHRCYGVDGQYHPERIAQVLGELNADVIGLQEVDTTLHTAQRERRGTVRRHGADENGGMQQLHFLAKQLNMHAVEGLLQHRHWGRYGNALLSRFPTRSVRQIDLTVRGGYERRGALDVELDVEGEPLRVFVAHLGLQFWERYFQMRRLVNVLGPDRTQRIVMMGDFNLWVSVLPRLRQFYGRLGHAPIVRTFPSRCPVLSLDRVWAQPSKALQQVHASRTALSAVASDHLPLVAQVAFSETSKALS